MRYRFSTTDIDDYLEKNNTPLDSATRNKVGELAEIKYRINDKIRTIIIKEKAFNFYPPGFRKNQAYEVVERSLQNDVT